MGLDKLIGGVELTMLCALIIDSRNVIISKLNKFQLYKRMDDVYNR